MKLKKAAFAFASVVALAVAVPAFALEIKEPKARIVVDVPDGWETSINGAWISSGPKDHTFHLWLRGVDHAAWKTEKHVEEGMVVYLAEHLKEHTIDTHAKRIEHWHGFEGYEVWGHGKRKSDGAEVKFFILVLRDEKTPSKGVVGLAMGTPAGYEKHHKGIYEAFKTLRAY